MSVADIKAIEAQAKVVAEFQGADSVQQMVVLLKLIEENYLQHLVEVTPDKLVAVQAQIRQLRALKKLLTGGGGTGRI